MIPKRPYLLAASCLMFTTAIAACGGSNNGNDGEEPVTPEGTHYGYVVSKPTVVLPATHSPTEYSLDLGSPKSSKLDGRIDNKLGTTLQGLGIFGFDIQGTVDTAVATGSLILLLDFQTKDFTTASAAGLSVKFGANPNPPACSNPADMTTCGQHLTGNATFQLAPSSPTDAELTGKVAGGMFTGGPGHISLQLAIGSTDPLVIDLVRARAQATGISANGMTVILAGLVTLSNLHDQIAPAIQRAVAGIVTRDCTPPGPPPGCGCIAQSPGALLIGQLDGTVLGDPANCMISVDEILGNPVVAPLLTPDSCSMDSCTESDALSIGVKVEAVKATFPM